MKVYEAMANAFIKEGTTTLFGLLGDGQMTWWSAMSKYPGLKIVDVRDEGCAVTMAEGWALATGKVGVASATQGPGLARMTTSLIVAARARTPLVVYTSKTAANNEHLVQYLNQDQLVTATGAGYIEVLKPSYAEDAVRDAFYRARRESRPYVLCARSTCSSWSAMPTATTTSLRARCSPDSRRSVRPSNNCAKPPASSRERRSRSSCSDAERCRPRRRTQRTGWPIASGRWSRPRSSPRARSPIRSTTRGFRGSFPRARRCSSSKKPIASSPSARRLSTHTLAGGYLYSQARFIHIDIEPHKLMGNDRGADCYVQGDAAATLQELLEELEREDVKNRGFHTAEVRRILASAGRDPAEFEIEPGTVDPREAIALLDEKLPPEMDLVSSGNAHACSFRVMLMKRRRGLQIFCTSFGCIGQALSTAVGAALGTGRPLVCVEGDGGALQNIQELDTVARLGLKFLYVVVNDEAYGAEFHKLRAHQRDPNLSFVRSPDFAGLGRDFGCRGRSARTLDEFSAAIDEFLAGDGPMVIDLRISRNVVSIPYRRLHFGMDV